MERKIAWQPTPRQITVLSRTEDEILYGGARGGGKSAAGMAWLCRHIANPLYRALVIRRNADDLKDWIDRARSFYLPTGATLVGNPAEIHFPSGAVIRTGHLKDASAYTKYQGHEYQNILIEELTHIAREKDYEALLGSCRSTVYGIKPQVFCTTNPDGDGHEWVKDRFKCEQSDDLPRLYPDTLSGLTKTRIFISAKVEDNPHLTQKDPNYIAFLNSIKDQTLRKQWRDGSWEEPKVEGAYYEQEMQRAKQDGRIAFVPYEKTLPVTTSWDLGIGDSMAIWFIQTVGNEVRFIDYFESEGQGLDYYVKILKEKPYIYEEHFAPHDIEVRELSDGKTRRDKAASLGINFTVVPNIPIDDGIDAVRTLLPKCWFDQEKCKDGIRMIRHYRKEFDEKRNTWKDKPEHDFASHCADSIRYFAVGFRGKPKTIPKFDFEFDRFGKVSIR